LAVFAAAASRAPANANVVEAGGSGTIAVTATSSFSFSPDEFSDVATNTTITLSFTNGDTIAHTFSLSSREGVVVNNNFSTSQLNSYFTTYPPLISEQANSSGTFTYTFTAPPTGWYEFVCLESGHFQKGMYGFIAFGEALPSNLTVTTPYDGPGAAVFIIVGTIVALTVVAIVLGFVVGRRRGSAEEMPPERLGYPEPAPPPGSQRLPDSSPPPKS
jgi:plastocyanin